MVLREANDDDHDDNGNDDRAVAGDGWAAAVAGARALAESDLDGLGDDALCAVAVSARQLRELAHHAEVRALGLVEERKVTDIEWGMTTAHWFGGCPIVCVSGARQVPAEFGAGKRSTCKRFARSCSMSCSLTTNTLRTSLVPGVC